MAQRKQKRQQPQKSNKPPMSKWDFEKIASVARTQNRKNRIANNKQAYHYTCKMMAGIIGGGDTTHHQRFFKDEPNRPEYDVFMKNAGCQGLIEFEEAERTFDSQKYDWEDTQKDAPSYMNDPEYYRKNYIKKYGSLEPPQEPEIEWK